MTQPIAARRIVIKIGTRLLTAPGGALDRPWAQSLVQQITGLTAQRCEVVLVSSGAIVAGMGMLGLRMRPASLPELQACASVGQGQLIRLYDELFGAHGLRVAQLLLTQEDFAVRERYLNIRNTVTTLLSHRIVPIVNENDTVSVDEIKLGDNDRLSALVANLVDAQLLIILSDVAGLLRQGELIRVVEQVTPELERLARGPRDDAGLGGMVTKLQAAKVATSSGITVVIADGREEAVLAQIVASQPVGTRFLPRPTRLASRKRWLAFVPQRTHGTIQVDAGAKEALLHQGKSLLPSGVSGCHGGFKAGDLVSITDAHKHEFARGLSNYAAKELTLIQGANSAAIEGLLGYKGYAEVVHRDNLVII
ncbi:MAG: glutamate 5-kinase [Candidatus Omnitrophica bacterium]|nr:glutamate 5-kinase [Candidatus Omnitrophota bacterium]